MRSSQIWFVYIDAVSSGGFTMNKDSSLQILAEEAVPLDQLDSQVRFSRGNLSERAFMLFNHQTFSHHLHISGFNGHAHRRASS